MNQRRILDKLFKTSDVQLSEKEVATPRPQQQQKNPPSISISTEQAFSFEDEEDDTALSQNSLHNMDASLPLGTSSVGHRQRKRTLSRGNSNLCNMGEDHVGVHSTTSSPSQQLPPSSDTYFMVDLDDADMATYQTAQSPADQESLALYKLLLQDMYESSDYFLPSDKNPPRTNIPTFHRHEIQLAEDGILGQGEFGTVRAVTSFGFKPIKTVLTATAPAPSATADQARSSSHNQKDLKTPRASSSSRSYLRSASYGSYPEQSQHQKLVEDEDDNYDDLLEIVSWSSSIEDDVSDLEDETEQQEGDTNNNQLPLPPSMPSPSVSSKQHHHSRIASTGSISKMATAHAHDMNEFAQEQVKASMIRRPTRDNRPRYAVKYVKDTIREQSRADAILDLASEALFLSRISHPNIVRLRATVGVPGTSSFMLVLDRLSDTLAHKIQNDWKSQAQALRQQTRPWAILTQRFNNKKKQTSAASSREVLAGDTADQHATPALSPESADHSLFLERLLAVYDIARALRHLHKHHLLFRDVKPENVAFDSRGQVRLFDFGLCKELKACDGNVADDAYRATGVTGSRRYMAPEVVRCLPYGFSADVYSWAVCTWQVFALETPYAEWDASQHMDRCVLGKKRPSKHLFANQACHTKKGTKNNALNSCQKRLWETVVEPGWAAEPRDRPTMESICCMLHSELSLIAPLAESGDCNALSLSDRSENLMNLSVHSIRRIMADRY